MSGLFEKLSTLFRARMNDFIDEIGSSVPRPGRMARHSDERTVESLRERINEAVAYENELQKQVLTLQDEIATFDRQADNAVNQGNDAMARHFISKMQRAEQRLDMAQRDLDAHQLVARDLIEQVNRLEAALADKKFREQQAAQAVEHEVEQAASDVPVQTEPTAADDARSAVEAFDGLYERTSSRIDNLGETIQKQKDRARQVSTDGPQPDAPSVDTDLEARRNRLMKK